MLTNNLARESLAADIRMIRRSIWREVFVALINRAGALDLSLAGLATLLFLQDGARSMSEVAAALGRSRPAVSRMANDLFARGLVLRDEDRQDRRVKRLSLSNAGRDLLAMFEQQRVDAQLAAMELLTPDEQATVITAMDLLANAVRRRYGNDRYDESRHEQCDAAG